VRFVRRVSIGPRPGPPAARAIAFYMLRLHPRLAGLGTLDEVETMTVDDLRVFAAASDGLGGAGALVRELDEASCRP